MIMVCVVAEGSFTSVVSGLISGGLRHVQFFDIVGFVLVVFVLWFLWVCYHILSSTILMSVTSIQYYRLFYSLFSPPLYPVPGCGELEVLPSIHADLYSDIMAVWICCCYFLVTDQLYTRNICYVVRLCGRGSWGTSFTQLTGSFSLLCRAVAAFLYDVWLVGLFLLMAQAWILCIRAFLNVSSFCGYRNVSLVAKFSWRLYIFS